MITWHKEHIPSKKWLFLAVLLLSLPQYIVANVKIHALFSDHMVIQRNTVIPIWGWADANEIITIETSWGEAKDIHPHNKMDAGKRLAYWALQNDYAIKIKAVSGPLYKSNKVKNNKFVIEFTEVGSGLMVGYKNLLEDAISVKEPLKWFEIKGTDGEWKTAEAKIKSKRKIEVWSAAVKEPIAVRYAWTGNAIGANLYNKEGLPAAVFTTEN